MSEIETQETEVQERATDPGKGVILEEGADYREALVELFKDRNFKINLPAEKRVEEAIGAVSAGSAIPEIWASEIERLHVYGQSAFLGAGFVNYKDDVKGRPGDTVHVPTVERVSAAEVTSGTEPTFTAATVSSVPVTLVQYGAGYYISKADLEDVVPSTVTAMNEGIGDALAVKVDEMFLSRIQAHAISGTLDSGGVAAGTWISKLAGSMEAGTYKPDVFICHPVTYAALLCDSQFTNAATWGNRGVLQTGKIPNFLGIDIIKIPQGTLVAASGGTYRSYLLSKGALVGAMKRGLDMESEYYVKDQRRYNVGNIRLGGTVAHTDGVWLLTTVNG